MSQCAGEAEQDHRGVPDAPRSGAVDAHEDLAHVVDVERSGRAAWGGAQKAAQSAADLADHVVVEGVGKPVEAVLVPDGSASQVEGGDTDALVGTLSQVGTDRSRFARKFYEPAASAPADPLPPGMGVRGAGGLAA